MKKIIIVDSYDKKLLDENITKVSNYLNGFKSIDFTIDKKKLYQSTYNFFDSLKDEESYLIKGSFYSNFVDSMLSRSFYFSTNELVRIESIQLFYFFLESEKPKTMKEIQKHQLFELLFKKSELPIKVKLSRNLNEALDDFKNQYLEYLIKINKYLLVNDKVSISKKVFNNIY